MKKSVKMPIEPNPPVRPISPEEFTYKLEFLLDADESLELNKLELPNGISLEDLVIDYSHDYDFPLKVFYKVKTEVKNYDKKLERYFVNLEKYNVRKESYDKRLEIYNDKYKKWQDSYNEIKEQDFKSNRVKYIKKLESDLRKLKKEVELDG